MSKSSKRVLFSAASALAVATMMGPASYAQEAEAAPSDDTKTLDTIVVTGIAASISKSVTDKRDATQIVDTINAEDIGKSTDQNIAEALNRVSGVSMSTVDGEGSQISIRGTNSNQNVVTLNGAALGGNSSTDNGAPGDEIVFNSGVDLSQYSSDILAKVEVIKTPSADDEEGSLGGLVNLITRKPLEIDENIRTFSVEGRYNEQSEQANHKLSGTFSQKFLDDKVGILVSLVDESNSVRRDQIQHTNWKSYETWGATDQNGNFLVNNFDPADANNQDPYAQTIAGLAPQQTRYGIREIDRDRQSLDFSAQWQISDRTDVSFNFNYAKQDVENNLDEFSIRAVTNLGTQNFRSAVDIDGNPIAHLTSVQGAGAILFEPTFSDPQADWHVLNTDTRTWERLINRFQHGDVNASIERYENENTSIGFEVNHEFTDYLRVTAGASNTKNERIPDQQLYANMQSARENPNWLRLAAGEFGSVGGVQPVGIDCTGGVCQPVTGTDFLDRGTFINAPTQAQIADAAANGVTGTLGAPITNRAADNFNLTGLNPDDLTAKSIGFVEQTIRGIVDEQDVAYIDFDFDLNRFGLTTTEFGGKYTKREKVVDNQEGIVTNINTAASVVDPVTGAPIQIGNALDQTPVQPFERIIDGEGLWEGLDLTRNNLTDGFSSIDAEGLFLTLAADPDLAINIDDSATRAAEFENIAVYAKQNFSFFDDRLTGDIGVRYVKTEVETSGAGGLEAFNETFGRDNRIQDASIIRMLTDQSLPVCPTTYLGQDIYYTDPSAIPAGEEYLPLGTQYRYTRIDGLGVDTKGTASFLDDTRIPNLIPDGGCSEPALADAATYIATNGAQILRRWNNPNFTNNFFLNFDDDPSNGEGFVTDASGNLLSSDNRIHTAASAGTHEYERFLPNLNLNWLIRDDLIARFAASKTMARPQIDDLRPGFRITENGWGDPALKRSTVNLFNTQLDPLESKNFDVSLEWYFQKDALLSLGLFYKDVINQREFEESTTYLTNVRQAIVEGTEVTDLLLNESEITFDNCYPTIQGEWQVQSWASPAGAADVYFGDEAAYCEEFNSRQVINGEGFKLKGAEFQYTQNYSFLPGIWGGLGLTANYTYQDSEVKGESPNPDLVKIDRALRTPEHSYNVTAYWQEGDHQLRLAYGGASDVLVQRAFQGGDGTLWEEGRETLDFSAGYQLSDNFSLTFQASNLLDQSVRTYFSSRRLDLPTDPVDGSTPGALFDEGDILSSGGYKGRTVVEYNTGRVFRLGLRAEF